MSAEAHAYVHELLEKDLSVRVIEEESVSDLETVLNELSRHSYDDIVTVSNASAGETPYVYWRYVAVVRKTTTCPSLGIGPPARTKGRSRPEYRNLSLLC